MPISVVEWSRSAFHCPAEARAAARVPWWRRTRAIGGVFGFEKNERANVSAKELEALQAIASDLLELSATELDAHVHSEALKEICHEHQD